MHLLPNATKVELASSIYLSLNEERRKDLEEIQNQIESGHNFTPNYLDDPQFSYLDSLGISPSDTDDSNGTSSPFSSDLSSSSSSLGSNDDVLDGPSLGPGRDTFKTYSFLSDSSSSSSSSSSSLGSNDDGVLHGPSLGPGGDVLVVDSGEKEGDDEETTINPINSSVNAMRVAGADLRHVSPSVEEESDEESSEDMMNYDLFFSRPSFSSDSSSSSSSLGSNDDGVLYGPSLESGGDVLVVDSGEKEGDDEETTINSINSSVNAMRVGADLRHGLPSVEEESDGESSDMTHDPFKAYSFSSDSSSSSSSLGSNDVVLHGPSLEPEGDEPVVDSGEKDEGDEEETTINSINSSVNAMRVVELKQALKKRNMRLDGLKSILKDRLLQALLEDVHSK
jgi:hypothetical protein